MSRWIEGRVYAWRGGEPHITCARRFFDGCLEMVELHHGAQGPLAGFFTHIDVRTARAAAVPMITPTVTETLGGVTRADLCDHRYGQLMADAGPFAGRLCCEACGAPPDEPIDSETMRTVIAAIERRVREGSHWLCTHLPIRESR